jgi:hypothetical protein
VAIVSGVNPGLARRNFSTPPIATAERLARKICPAAVRGSREVDILPSGRLILLGGGLIPPRFDRPRHRCVHLRS